MKLNIKSKLAAIGGRLVQFKNHSIEWAEIYIYPILFTFVIIVAAILVKFMNVDHRASTSDPSIITDAALKLIPIGIIIAGTTLFLKATKTTDWLTIQDKREYPHLAWIETVKIITFALVVTYAFFHL